PQTKGQRLDQLKFRKKISPEVFRTFAKFRDVNRKPHSYNRVYNYQNTGAFMTWLIDENDLQMPRGIAPPEAGPRIPFGRNDMDCVVNTNVMKLLTWSGHTQTPGYVQTCEYLKKTIDLKDYGYCGIYYPNKFA